MRKSGLILRMWCGLKFPGFGTAPTNEARAVRGWATTHEKC